MLKHKGMCLPRRAGHASPGDTADGPPKWQGPVSRGFCPTHFEEVSENTLPGAEAQPALFPPPLISSTRKSSAMRVWEVLCQPVTQALLALPDVASDAAGGKGQE